MDYAENNSAYSLNKNSDWVFNNYTHSRTYILYTLNLKFHKFPIKKLKFASINAFNESGTLNEHAHFDSLYLIITESLPPPHIL